MQCFCTEQPDPVLLKSPASFPLNSAPDNKPLVPSRFHALLFPHWFTGCDWCSWLVLQLHTAPSLKKTPIAHSKMHKAGDRCPGTTPRLGRGWGVREGVDSRGKCAGTQTHCQGKGKDSLLREGISSLLWEGLSGLGHSGSDCHCPGPVEHH